MAFGHTQLLAQFLNAVERHIVLPDGRHGLGHQRRQGARRFIGPVYGAEQCIGHCGRADAVQLGQQLGRAGAGRTVRPARRTQLQQVRICTAACQPHPQQVAVRPGGQCQRRSPQQDIPALPRAVNPVQKADPARQHPHPQAGAGQGKRLRAVQFSDFGSAAIYFRVKYQFQHLYINKMLFSNRL